MATIKKKTSSKKPVKLNLEIATEENKELEQIETTEVIQEEQPKSQEASYSSDEEGEVVADLSEIDTSEFEEVEKEIPKPVQQIVSEEGLISFDDFYDWFYKGGFKVLSFVVGYKSVEEFGSKEKMAQVVYKRMARSPMLKKLLSPTSENMADLMIVATTVMEVAPSIAMESAEKKAKKLEVKPEIKEVRKHESAEDMFS